MRPTRLKSHVRPQKTFASSRFTLPSRANICFIPIAPTNGGRIIGSMISALRKRLPGNSRRTVTSASGRATAVVAIVTVMPMSSELIIDARRMGLPRVSMKNVPVHLPSHRTDPFRT